MIGRVRQSRRTGVDPKVVFTRGERGLYWSHVHRPDGAVVFVPGYDRKYRVPHDLAHVATERSLGMTDGVFGSIMDGAVFENMRVVSGRLSYHARQRSPQVLRANSASRGLAVAEVLAGVVHRAVEHGGRGDLLRAARAQWEVVREEPFPFTADDLSTARGLLEELGARWEAVAVEGELDVPWRVGRSVRWRAL